MSRVLSNGKLTRSLIALYATVLFSCKSSVLPAPADYELAIAWAGMSTSITQTTPANSPTFASRAFGYIGLTMYESIVQGYPTHESVAPQLNGLGVLALPEPGLNYHWPLALNAGQAEILRLIYVQTGDENKKRIDSLEAVMLTRFQSVLNDDSLVNRSVDYGKKIAAQIFEWSKTDGGHRGYLNNFDKKMEIRKGPGFWQPPLYAQSFSHFPLHPHWGKNRTFLVSDSMMEAPVPLLYDTIPGSPYYEQFRMVYEKRKNLSDTEKEAALWWGDDPDLSFTPPGHSYSLGSIAIKKAKPDLITCAETYARIGIAVADAFRNCWKWKFLYYTERANTYIPTHMDPEWESFWPDPPFPAFPSGHAIQAAAAATVLTDLYGDSFAFTDSSHVGRPADELRKVEFKARSFASFWKAAEETALSRFYGGIHIPMDNEKGLEKGKEIGENVNALRWRK
jgi:hypothetical protein